MASDFRQAPKQRKLKVCAKQLAVQWAFSMAVAGIAAVSRVSGIAATILNLGNNYYKASADWDDFPRKIAILKRKHEFWTKEFARSSMLSDAALMETLGEAEKLLERERAKLEGREAECGAGCFFMVSRTMFPAKVGLGIQHVIDTFNAIPGFLQQEEEAAVALEKRMMRRRRALAFRDDDRYVPLKLTESKVYAALEDPDGSQIVLLYGGPGKGKSTLARRVALQYDCECKNPRRQFDLVAFLECGPKADILASQLKLANLISPNSGATADPEAQRTTDYEDAIWRRLEGLLKYQRILIELDDVCEPEFLQKMLLLCGDGVKCLVTSQDRDLCRDISLRPPAVQIQIEDIQDDVAMRILASHVGFRDKRIPAHIQGLAHKVILGMEKHPLALASVAKEIDPDRSHELEEWEAASESFLTALQSTVTKRTFGVAYPESFWLTTQRSIDAVRAKSPDAPSLLILLHMCEAPSVPEAVLKILFCSVICEDVSDQVRLSKFKMSMMALRSRGLVNISSRAQSSYFWSAHSLQKLFVEHEMNDQKESVLQILRRKSYGIIIKRETDLSEHEDRKVWMSLCALYFHQHYFEKTTLEMCISSDHLSSVRRSAIEPLTLLLALPVSERWSASGKSSVKQVYLRYIYDFAVHGSGMVYLMASQSDILYLLASQVSVLPTLQVLENIISLGWEKAWIGESLRPLVKALLGLLGNMSRTGDVEIAVLAARVFSQLSWHQLHQGVIMSCGIFDTVEKILSSDTNPRLQAPCRATKWNIRYNDSKREKETVGRHREFVEQMDAALDNLRAPRRQSEPHNAALDNLRAPRRQSEPHNAALANLRSPRRQSEPYDAAYDDMGREG